MKIRIVAATAAVLIGLAAPVTSALAFESFPPRNETPSYVLDRDDLTTGSIDRPMPRDVCRPSPDSEGNANMQARAVKNYGGTNGGYDCY